MKILRNPIVASLLAAAALGVVGWNIAGPMLKRPRPAKAASVSVVSSATEVKAAKGKSANAVAARSDKGTSTKGNRPMPIVSEDTGAMAPGQPMDLAEIQSKIREWIEAPRRDPFERQAAAAVAAEGPKAEDVLFIKAIWRQTGSRFAVINNLILEEGGLVSGFTLESIESDFVRVRGSNGLERVEFSLVPKRKPAARAAGAGARSTRVARAP